MATKWHKGPPPSVGWWPASANNPPEDGWYRWFDGEVWSLPSGRWNTPKEAAGYASEPSAFSEFVQWTARPASWPKRSRT